MKIYISGQITGIPIEESTANFDRLEKRLTDAGHEVLNPMKLTHNHEKTWLKYMQEDIYHLMDCEFLVFMENSVYSKGAGIEICIARMFEIPVCTEKQFFEP